MVWTFKLNQKSVEDHYAGPVRAAGKEVKIIDPIAKG